MYKKAQGMQFNWIFILIAGTIILVLFIAFAIDYRNLSFKKSNTQLAISLDSQLDLLSIEKIATEINPAGLNDFKIDFSCNDFSINDGNEIDISNKIIFAPSSIKTSSLLLWTDELYLPYKVADLVYISSPNIKYYLYPANQVQEFLEYLPKKFNTNNQFFNIEAINSINQYKIEQDILREQLQEVKFILFENIQVPDFNIKTTKININPIENLDFGQTNSNYYIKKQLLLASSFSDNYNCFLDKIVDKISLLNQIYKEKAIKLANRNPSCSYQPIISNLNEPILNPEQLYENQKRISEKNKNLFIRGCSDVY